MTATERVQRRIHRLLVQFENEVARAVQAECIKHGRRAIRLLRTTSTQLESRQPLAICQNGFLLIKLPPETSNSLKRMAQFEYLSGGSTTL